MFSVTPELQPDLYWTVSVPENLPYTACTAHLRKEPPSPSTAHIASHVSVSSRSLYESIYQSISDDYQTIQPLGTKAPNRSIYQTLRSRSSNLFRSLMRKKAPTALVHAHCETPREERVKGKEPVTGKTPGEDGAASASLNRRNQATSVEERIFFV
ncbi:unnamed protein product [Darwinula stevensoni]|uniref:Uncharacterized protein n=1 Tax=Darwinula stevensoni TaxID=69355 RepID=A0A7R9AE24_9CRUS|nr:unnamed protein product [Darwinula stevensoni]CAG0901939.1 unnamed protein product [Darwinula stevensoni]